MLLAKKDQYEYDGEGYYKACTNPMSNIEKMKYEHILNLELWRGFDRLSMH